MGIFANATCVLHSDLFADMFTKLFLIMFHFLFISWLFFLTYVNLCLWFYMHQYVSERRFVCTLASFFANMDGRISTIVPSHALVDLGVFFFPSQKYPCAWNFFPSSSSTGQKHRGGTRVIYFVRGEGSDFGSCFLWGKGFPFFLLLFFPYYDYCFPPKHWTNGWRVRVLLKTARASSMQWLAQQGRVLQRAQWHSIA